MNPQALFAAFDIFPTSKGASRHIQHSLRALQGQFGQVAAYTLGTPMMLPEEQEGGLVLQRFRRQIPNYLDRALAYTEALAEAAPRLAPQAKLYHFRDIWSGLALLPLAKARGVSTVFELNGLTSIELPYRYPRLSAAVLAKLRYWEEQCLAQSDLILTPSPLLASRLSAQGYALRYLPNGASLVDLVRPLRLSHPRPYILYFGALQPWQGLDTLLRALARLPEAERPDLLVCSSNRPKQGKIWRNLAQTLGLADWVHWHYELAQGDLQDYILQARLCVAPLKDTARNSVQGCSPLKIFESMACAKAILASDLAVCRAVLRHGHNAWLVPADRPDDWARALRLLLAEPERAQALGQQALADFQAQYTWTQIEAEMGRIYQQLLPALCHESNPS